MSATNLNGEINSPMWVPQFVCMVCRHEHPKVNGKNLRINVKSFAKNKLMIQGNCSNCDRKISTMFKHQQAWHDLDPAYRNKLYENGATILQEVEEYRKSQQNKENQENDNE